jgi:cytidine deaminase
MSKTLAPPSPQKSGDSARQDAEAARQQDHKAALPPMENIPAKVQDAVDVKKEQGASQEVLEQTQRALAALAAVVEGLNKKIVTLEQAKSVNVIPTMEPLMTCGVCRQTIYNERTKRGVCTGKHTSVRVMPRDSRFNQAFQGWEHNGVVYYGRCMLPDIIIDTVKVGISRWEAVQLDRTIPRGRKFRDQDARGLPSAVSMPFGSNTLN